MLAGVALAQAQTAALHVDQLSSLSDEESPTDGKS
jgi:hypothetical protein